PGARAVERRRRTVLYPARGQGRQERGARSMTKGQESGREHGLAVLKLVTKRGTVVVALVVAAAVATVVGASATTHGSRVHVAVLSASSPQASTSGLKSAKPAKPRARKAVRGHLPKAVKRSRLRALHLTRAHSKVFDVRSLKSAVVKKER